MKKKKTRQPAPAEVDERVLRSKKAVLAATYQLLSESGLSGVSVDAVSKRSGVAKTTIYRHWPSRSALLLDACSSMGSRPQVPDMGSIKGDLQILVDFLVHQLRTAAWATATPSIIDAAERDRELAKIQARIHSHMRSPLLKVIERAQQKGEVPPDSDPSHMIAAVLGPLFYRRWLSREPLDAAFAKDIVERVTRG